MTYQETVNYLYACVPMFQNIGAGAYKEGLSNTLAFDEHLGHPHRRFKTIHVAGTNGKGSCSHTLAAILQHSGLKVGLYTSPHLVDFRERIRINGQPISEEYVVRFVEEERKFFEPLRPSFFEVTTALAFKYFADQGVDVAVIEVGLGGRLDCTNIITPVLSLITNIGFDHTQFLGSTLAEIASEKAGIIKPGVPVVVGETTEETKPVFLSKAQEVNAPITFAEEGCEVLSSEVEFAHSGRIYQTRSFGELRGELSGLCQEENTNSILKALPILRDIGFNISQSDVREGFKQVCKTTGLMGRWQKLGDRPLTICDTGHNPAGFQYISRQLKEQRASGKVLRIVFGMVDDKDVDAVLKMLPKEAVYYFCSAQTKRAIKATLLREMAGAHNLAGASYSTVIEAYCKAKEEAAADDFIFIGGSSYVVADLLSAKI